MRAAVLVVVDVDDDAPPVDPGDVITAAAPGVRVVEVVPQQACVVCGCTEFSPCEDGCWWIALDLCSACITIACPDPALAGAL